MIMLTKLNNSPLLLNLEAVKYIEETPDTLVFFVNGESVIVKESLATIKEKIVVFQAEIMKKAQQL